MTRKFTILKYIPINGHSKVLIKKHFICWILLITGPDSGNQLTLAAAAMTSCMNFCGKHKEVLTLAAVVTMVATVSIVSSLIIFRPEEGGKQTTCTRISKPNCFVCYCCNISLTCTNRTGYLGTVENCGRVVFGTKIWPGLTDLNDW